MHVFWRIVQKKWQRDRHLPARLLLHKSIDYLAATLTAPLYLRCVNRVGHRVRTLGGAPRVVNYGYMSIGDDTRLSSHNVPIELFAGPNAVLHIGSGVNINYGVSIGALKSIYIGSRVRIGPYVRVVDSDFHDIHDRRKTPPARAVHIEDDVWLGMNAVVLNGVKIGRGAVIGTGAVVTHDVPPFGMVVGVPGRVVKYLDPEKFVPEYPLSILA